MVIFVIRLKTSNDDQWSENGNQLGQAVDRMTDLGFLWALLGLDMGCQWTTLVYETKIRI